jgi:HK97 family phage prohead protease
MSDAVEERLIETAARIVALDEATRRVRHVISTGRMDRYNRIVDPAGWSLTNFREAPRVLADHDYGIEAVIGRAHDTKVENDALMSTTEFDREGKGNVAFRLVQRGFVNSWSVGWIGQKAHRFGELDDCEICNAAGKRAKYGVHFTRQELLEYSLVAIPANPDAVMSIRAAGLCTARELDEWVADVCEPARERTRAFLTELELSRRNFARCAAAMVAARHLKGER